MENEGLLKETVDPVLLSMLHLTSLCRENCTVSLGLHWLRALLKTEFPIILNYGLFCSSDGIIILTRQSLWGAPQCAAVFSIILESKST